MALELTKTGNKMSKLLTSKELAEKLSVSNQFIALSRTTGQLMGIEAPKHLKMGRTVRYEESTIEEWLNNFREVSK
jgi:predicted DNA-binding transcriptional regulator AlpA